jgi:hypothetical protein
MRGCIGAKDHDVAGLGVGIVDLMDAAMGSGGC